jgi:hypothetical protein
MKNSVVNSQKAEADKMLSDFKEENKDMLNDMEIIKDYVNFTIQPPREQTELQFAKNHYDLIIIVSCLLSTILNLIFRIQWLTIFVLILQLVIMFLVHLIIIDYDFLDDKFARRFNNFLIKNNRLYAIILIVILYRCESSFMLKYAFIMLDDLFNMVFGLLKYFDKISKQRLDNLKSCFSFLEFTYTAFLSIYFFSFLTVSFIKFSVLIIAFLIFRYKVNNL